MLIDERQQLVKVTSNREIYFCVGCDGGMLCENRTVAQCAIINYSMRLITLHLDAKCKTASRVANFMIL